MTLEGRDEIGDNAGNFGGIWKTTFFGFGYAVRESRICGIVGFERFSIGFLFSC